MNMTRKDYFKLPGHSEAFQNPHKTVVLDMHDANDEYKSDFVGSSRFERWRP